MFYTYTEKSKHHIDLPTRTIKGTVHQRYTWICSSRKFNAFKSLIDRNRPPRFPDLAPNDLFTVTRKSIAL